MNWRKRKKRRREMLSRKRGNFSVRRKRIRKSKN
jgi:hypothetical protein